MSVPRLVCGAIFGLVVLSASACASGGPLPAPTSQPVANVKPAATVPAAQPAAAPAASPVAAPQSQARPTDTGGASPARAILQVRDRRVIYTTSLTLLVQDLDTISDKLGTLALAHGGYLAGVESSTADGIPAVIVKLKVPPEQYEAAMADLRGLAVDVRDQKATTQDVTEEYADVQTQIASLEATHAQLLELMKRSGSVDELLKVEQQADAVRLQIDRLKGRAAALERLSDLASVTVTAQLASAAIQRDFLAARTALRRVESTRASLTNQLSRARSPEEEASLTDKLADAQLERQRDQARLDELITRATALQITLPSADDVAPPIALETSLPRQYLDTRVALRKAESLRDRLSQDLRAGKPDADPAALSDAILQVTQLSAQVKSLQDRANQAGVTLPSLSRDDEAVLARVPSPLSVAWEWAAAIGLAALGAAGVGVLRVRSLLRSKAHR